MSNSKLLTLTVCLAFSVGLGGGLISNYFSRAPATENLGLLQSAPEAPPVQTEIVREILPENAVSQVAEKLHDSVVSIVGTKDIEYVRRDPRSFFWFEGSPFGAPFGRDPFFEHFFEVPRPDSYQEPEVQRERQQIAAGTGFVIATEGLILTNKHVVSDPKAEYTVIFADKTEYLAEVLTRDPKNDLAILKIKQRQALADSGAESEAEARSESSNATEADSEATAKTEAEEALGSQEEESFNFTAVEFVTAKEQVKVGQFVIAIGNALGEFDNTLTLGIISAKSRSITAGDGYGKAEQLSQLLQTDAAINPGNSGGPLVSLEGKVLGVNTAIAGSAEGIGFAIPIEAKQIRKILSQVADYGRILRPWLGVRYQLVTPKLNQELKLGTDQGAWIQGENDLPAVIANTPAAEAGLKGGDIILAVNEEEVSLENTLTKLLDQYAPEETVELTLLRDGRELKLKVTLGTWEEE